MQTEVAPIPRAHAPLFFGNGILSTVLTPSGTGYSLYRDVLLGAWQDDPCDDEYGLAIWVRDPEGGAFSAAGAPLAGDAPRTLLAGAQCASIASGGEGLAAEVTFSMLAGAAQERRELVLTNLTDRARVLEVTAVLEVVLNTAPAQEGHPAFSKLFVQTAFRPEAKMLVATRRPRGAGETPPALGLALEGSEVLSFETDRVRLVGRGRSLADPVALTAPLGDSLGNVLDPALALRTRITLPARGRATLAFVLVAADDAAGLEAARLARGEHVAPRPIATAPPEVLTLATATLGPAGGSASRTRPQRFRHAGPGALPTGNGHGEFVDDGRVYRIAVGRAADGTLRLPPMPWTNVIANESFGLIASEKGSLSTFCGNSRLHRLTPWRNDPVTDPHDEALYVRDEASGAWWSALPGPAPVAATYEVRHGHGWSQWRHESMGLGHELTVYVPREDPVRLARLVLTNPGSTPRALAVYSYARLVLGGTPAETQATLAASIDQAQRTVLATNPDGGPFAERVAFAAFAGEQGYTDATTDRREFLGVPGSLDAPRAVVAGGALVPGTAGAPCAALRTVIVVPPGGQATVTALLGEAASAAAAAELVMRYRTPGAAESALAEVCAFWGQALSAIRITTPLPALDVMVNGWLAYQTLVCRLWARSAYYQSGGAYGFRDQLQDAASLAQTHPDVLRRQLLVNAAHQFPEGDVLHWWHPPASEGIRTKFADDLVWLPWLAAHYIRTTGDAAILEEPVGFVGGPLLEADEDERYFAATRLPQTATLYEHCVRALDRAMTQGDHGLPLFGCGDWNDGMNRVGREGRGESVWMGFFLYLAIGEFLPHVRARGDAAHVARLGAYREDIAEAVNAAGWDGGWYRRGYYDNGVALGSKDGDECRIDALAQAWAVISGVAPPARREMALDAMDEQLISTDDGLVRLLAPPFVDTKEDPGYIKGYVAGVRENGGQYTHAALWVVRALAEAGRRDRAAEVLAMLCPATHAATPAGVERYKVEPYVVAADVYGAAPHVGRGGWTWYTGSAGWMLRVAVESVLGLTVEKGTHLVLAPRVPDTWPGFTIEHRRPDGTSYAITVENPSRSAARVVAATIDGVAFPVERSLSIPLAHDGARHEVHVTLGTRG